jgi:hypothetical protein
MCVSLEDKEFLPLKVYFDYVHQNIPIPVRVALKLDIFIDQKMVPALFKDSIILVDKDKKPIPQSLIKITGKIMEFSFPSDIHLKIEIDIDGEVYDLPENKTEFEEKYGKYGENFILGEDLP